MWLSWRVAFAGLEWGSRYGNFQKSPTVLAFRKIFSTFCTEAAVLLAIFPILDYAVEQQQIRDSSSVIVHSASVDIRMVAEVSVMLAVVFIGLAVITAVKTPNATLGGDDEEED